MCTSGGTCSPTCALGYQSCKNPAPPAADDGCECATPGCCAGGCAVTHKNCVGTGSSCGIGQGAIGQDYWVSGDYCAAVARPGTDSTYTMAMAQAAASAAPQPSGLCSTPPCVGVTSCTTNASAHDATYVNLTDSAGPCIVWAFKTTGAGQAKSPSGHVHIDMTGCFCPTSADPTWD
jgi:hypothetical protein